MSIKARLQRLEHKAGIAKGQELPKIIVEYCTRRGDPEGADRDKGKIIASHKNSDIYQEGEKYSIHTDTDKIVSYYKVITKVEVEKLMQEWKELDGTREDLERKA